MMRVRTWKRTAAQFGASGSVIAYSSIRQSAVPCSPRFIRICRYSVPNGVKGSLRILCRFGKMGYQPARSGLASLSCGLFAVGRAPGSRTPAASRFRRLCGHRSPDDAPVRRHRRSTAGVGLPCFSELAPQGRAIDRHLRATPRACVIANRA